MIPSYLQFSTDCDPLALWYALTDGNRLRWRVLFGQVQFESESVVEAFTESYRRWVNGLPQPSLAVTSFFNTDILPCHCEGL